MLELNISGRMYKTLCMGIGRIWLSKA